VLIRKVILTTPTFTDGLEKVVVIGIWVGCSIAGMIGVSILIWIISKQQEKAQLATDGKNATETVQNTGGRMMVEDSCKTTATEGSQNANSQISSALKRNSREKNDSPV
jgi:hypothetical protein